MIGQLVSHYRVLERAGAGGMGVVYLAEDVRLGRRVALKFLTPPALSDGLAGERFYREARALAALSHPGIAMVFDAGEHEGAPYLVMEWVNGSTLESCL